MTTNQNQSTNPAQTIAEFDAIIRATVDGIVVIDEHGIVELFNRGAEHIFGYQEAEVVGKNVAMLMPAPDRDQHDGYISNYLQGNAPKIIGRGREVVGLRRNGETFPMELAVGDASTDGSHRFVGVVKDISDRRETENALTASELQHRTLFDRAPLGIFTADRQGRFLSMNPMLRRWLEFDDEASYDGASCINLCDELSEQKARALLTESATSLDGSASAQLQWRAHQGRLIIVDVHLSFIQEPEQAGYFIGHVTDRTREVEAAAGLQLAQQKIAQAGRLTTLGEMASAIAHEINQPLTAISTYAQACRRLLKSNDSDPATIGEVFDSIYEQSVRASEVVQRIRAFVRDRESKRTHEDINRIVSSSVELVAYELEKSDVQLTQELSPKLPAVSVDRIQIQQVCLNLIRNAIDAVSDLAGRREIVVATTTTSTGVAVSVADNGSGIAEEHRATLFQPFLTTKDHGMGLGLSISHSIIHAHGGRLAYADAESGGARFTFDLPGGDSADE